MSTTDTRPTDAPSPEDIKAVPVRHPWRWVVVAILAVLFLQLLNFLFVTQANRRAEHKSAIDWNVVWQYLFDPTILRGVGWTLALTAIAMIIGVSLGLILAVMRLSTNPVLRSVAWIYIWFFRGTPVYVQILFWFFLPSIMNSISVGIPFWVSWGHWDPTLVINSLVAACLGLGLNEGAYMAEIVRAGLISVDDGQIEAAAAIGLGRSKTMWRIVIPQAMRVIVPPTGNETISMLKTTALVAAISFTELFYAAQIIYARNYQTISLFVVACIWYLFLTSILMTIQYYIERYYAKGAMRQLPPTPIQKLRAMIGVGG